MTDQKTILVVDDDASQRGLYESHLTDAGFHVLSAASREEALPVLQSNRNIALLLTDGNMETRFAGVELIRDAREAGITIPAVLITSGGAVYERELAKIEGPNHYFEKNNLGRTGTAKAFHETLLGLVNETLQIAPEPEPAPALPAPETKEAQARILRRRSGKESNSGQMDLF